MKRSPVAFVCVIACLSSWTAALLAHPDDPKILDYEPPYQGPGWISGQEPAPRGDPFEAVNVVLKSWISIPDFGTNADSGNDCWGYTSPGGREYAIVGLSNATAFVEITDPANAQIVQVFPGPNSLWRDIKTYGSFAYAINQDNAGLAAGAGIQVFDMSNIDATSNRIVELPNVTTGGSVATHNVAIDTTSGFLYRCGGINGMGLRIYSLANPAAPVHVATWQDRYVHDAQVVTYTEGPYAGRQIAFCCAGYNNGSVETALDILDVTNKGNIFLVARYFYSNSAYSHQGWLSPDRHYFYLDDELDEQNNPNIPTTTTRVIDVSDIANPVEVGTYTNGNTAIDHNLYTRDGFIYAANYRSGLRIFNALDPTAPFEVGYFDTYPNSNSATFNGAWSNYPYFPSGTVIVSDLNRGLFVLDPSAALKSLKFTFPDGVPSHAFPDGSTSFRVVVESGGVALPQPGTGMLYVDSGSGFQATAMAQLSPNEYLAELPAQTCGQSISFYVSAETSEGDEYTNPMAAPATAYQAVSAFGGSVALFDDFETDNGWTPSNLGATAGDWQRGVPFVDPNWPYGPTADGDGSGQCWLTENLNNPAYPQPYNTDVDGGAVRLTSPVLDMSMDNAGIEYRYYLRLTDAGGADRMLVEINTTGGSGTWTPIAAHTDNAGAWLTHAISAEALQLAGVTPTANTVLRFTVNDANPQTVVEAGLDGFSLTSLLCEPDCAGPSGDLNADGATNGSDVSAFVAAVLGSPSANQICAGDYTGDSAITSDDAAGFVSALLAP